MPHKFHLYLIIFQPQTFRSSEPTPTIVSTTTTKENVPWKNFYFELPTLEESEKMELQKLKSHVAAFGGVASNTMRPQNSFDWLAKLKNLTKGDEQIDNEEEAEPEQVVVVVYNNSLKFLMWSPLITP